MSSGDYHGASRWQPATPSAVQQASATVPQHVSADLPAQARRPTPARIRSSIRVLLTVTDAGSA